MLCCGRVWCNYIFFMILYDYYTLAITSQSEQTPHEGELVPNLKEQFLQQLKQEVSSYNSKLPTGSAGVIRRSGNIGPIKRVCLCRHVCVVCVWGVGGGCVSVCIHTCVHVGTCVCACMCSACVQLSIM